MKDRIPFHRLRPARASARYVARVLASGRLGPVGSFTARCQELLASRLAGAHVLLTTSGTAALEMAALLAGVGAGDEVILPSFTFASTANAFALRGARLRFADIEPATLGLAPADVERRLGERTRVVCGVHYGGAACAIEELAAITARAGATLVEDAAQGLEARSRGRSLGTIGRFGALSFHQTKNVACGQGGALLINDPADLARARRVWRMGTNRSEFDAGRTDHYTWHDLGSSFAPSELVAAVLLAELERAGALTRERRRLWDRYARKLSPLAGRVTLPATPAGDRDHNGHTFYLLAEDASARSALLDHLRDGGVDAAFHYVPLHSSPMGRRLDPECGPLPVTESVAARLVRLPLHAGLTVAAQDRVVARLASFFGAQGRRRARPRR